MNEADERVLEIAPGDQGRRLDVFLAEALGTSRAQVRRLLARGAVALDGRALGASEKGSPLPGQGTLRVAGYRPAAEQQPVPEPAAALAVLARGPGWLVVDKPAGQPVHPLREAETGTLLNALVARHPEVKGVGEGGLRSGVVHRLDVDTSGALLVATREETWRRLRDAFRRRRVEKVYRAIVLGRLERPQELRAGLRVAQHRPARVRVVAAEEAVRDSRVRIGTLRVQPLEVFAGASLVEVRPETGFLHQIRASLAQLGHPVAGDRVYGPPDDGSGARRQLLHAARLAFEEVRAESPEPADFRSHLARLRQ